MVSPESENEFNPEFCFSCGGPESFLTSPTLGLIQEAADRGCPTCSLLEDVIEKYSPTSDEYEAVAVIRSSGVNEINIGPNGPDSLPISFYGHRDPNSLWLALNKNAHPTSAGDLEDIIGDTSSAEALDLAKMWIYNCDDHEDCQPETQSLLPTRVLDLGDPDEECKIRLYETLIEPAKYITLSHCWGDQNLFKTQTHSLPSRTQGIEWEELPRTFQDAVTMTRALGIRYLWIDSLCIVQDDEDDWRRESAKMYTIYQDSYLTLAASKNKGADGGLFSVAEEYDWLCDWETETQEEMVRTRRKIHHFESTEAFPLLQRGWVFQERLLSRRLLHFGSKELIWECMETQDCECSFFESTLHQDHGLGWKKMYQPANNQGLFGWFMFVWWKIVKDYSTTKLTYEKDIFPAISGVAQLQMKARGSKHLAGLWEDSFVYDLLWYIPKVTPLPGIETYFTRGSRPSKWRAPTWSWASVRSAVQYDLYDGLNSAIVIEEVQIKPAGVDVAGELENAWLTVTGELASVSVHRRANESGTQVFDVFLTSGDKEIPSLAFCEDYNLWSESEDQIADGDRLHCLVVGRVCRTDKSGQERDQLWFIVLREANGIIKEYVRVGLAMMGVIENEPPPEFLDTFVGTQSITIR